MLNWINIKELEELVLEEKKALGCMRLDWLGSRRDEVCNQWFPSSQINQVLMEYSVSVQQLQQELNELIFNQLNFFEKVIEICRGEGYGYEQLFKVETSAFDFFIRLKPVQDDYSHVFVYAK